MPGYSCTTYKLRTAETTTNKPEARFPFFLPAAVFSIRDPIQLLNLPVTNSFLFSMDFQDKYATVMLSIEEAVEHGKSGALCADKYQW